MTDTAVRDRPRRSSALAHAFSTSERAAVATLALLTLVALVLLYRKGLGTTFYYDEWNFVMNRRDWDVDTFLRPHNEHLSLVPIALFKVLFVTVGLDSYAVYRCLLLAVHVICVALVFLLARDRVGGPLALAFAVPVLFLGTAWNDLLVPFQVSFLISVAAGLAMLLALERAGLGADVAAAAMLAVALASSSVGIAFAAAALAYVLLRADRWRRLWVFAVPTLLYLLWSLAYGDPTATAGDRSLPDLARDNLPAAPGYVATAAAGAFGAVTGLGVDWGRPLAAVAFVLLALYVARGGLLRPRLVALLAVAAVYWGLAGVFRAHVNPPTDSRYLYLGAILVLLLVAELARPVPLTPRLAAVLAIVVGASVLANFGPLRDGSRYLQEWSRYVRAELAALEVAGPRTRADFKPDPVRAPDITAERYFEAVRDHGSPAASPAEVARLGDAERQAADTVLLQALGAAVFPAGSSARAGAPAVEAADGGAVRTEGGCVRFAPREAGATLDVAVPAAGLVVQHRGSSPVELRLRSFAGTFPNDPFGSIAPRQPHSFRIPRRPGRAWHARVAVPTPAPVSVCAAAG